MVSGLAVVLDEIMEAFMPSGDHLVDGDKDEIVAEPRSGLDVSLLKWTHLVLRSELEIKDEGDELGAALLADGQAESFKGDPGPKAVLEERPATKAQADSSREGGRVHELALKLRQQLVPRERPGGWGS